MRNKLNAIKKKKYPTDAITAESEREKERERLVQVCDRPCV
jgi:hypothetical protein